MSRALVLLCVFCFLEVFATFGQKQKKLEKTKKKSSHRAIVSRVLVLLCVFCFLEVFLWFLVKKNKKNRENFV